MVALELFAGKRSFGKVAEQYGFDVFSIENDEKHRCNITMDVLDFFPDNFELIPDVIWASPVCTSFSIASGGRHRGKDLVAKTETGIIGEKLVKKTLEIINTYKKRNSQIIWFIENPRGLLQKMDFMEPLEPYKKTVTYCQYGHWCMKPTNIWTNLRDWHPKKCCKNGDKCHSAAPRGSSGGIRSLSGMTNRSLVPDELFHEVLSIVTGKKYFPYH